MKIEKFYDLLSSYDWDSEYANFTNNSLDLPDNNEIKREQIVKIAQESKAHMALLEEFFDWALSSGHDKMPERPGEDEND